MDLFFFTRFVQSVGRSNPGRFGPGSFRPGRFGVVSANFWVSRFGLRRWVVSALGRFGQISIGGRDRGIRIRIVYW